MLASLAPYTATVSVVFGGCSHCTVTADADEDDDDDDDDDDAGDAGGDDVATRNSVRRNRKMGMGELGARDRRLNLAAIDCIALIQKRPLPCF